jgi:hypothetical protein
MGLDFYDQILVKPLEENEAFLEAWTSRMTINSDDTLSGETLTSSTDSVRKEKPCVPVRVHEDIEKDVYRTFPENALFQTQAGRDALRRVLLAFAAYEPEIGYCQSLNFIAGTLLLFLTESDAFCVMAHLVQSVLPSGYYTSKVSEIPWYSIVNGISESSFHSCHS